MASVELLQQQILDLQQENAHLKNQLSKTMRQLKSFRNQETSTQVADETAQKEHVIGTKTEGQVEKEGIEESLEQKKKQMEKAGNGGNQSIPECETQGGELETERTINGKPKRPKKQKVRTDTSETDVKELERPESMGGNQSTLLPEIEVAFEHKKKRINRVDNGGNEPRPILQECQTVGGDMETEMTNNRKQKQRKKQKVRIDATATDVKELEKAETTSRDQSTLFLQECEAGGGELGTEKTQNGKQKQPKKSKVKIDAIATVVKDLEEAGTNGDNKSSVIPQECEKESSELDAKKTHNGKHKQSKKPKVKIEASATNVEELGKPKTMEEKRKKNQDKEKPGESSEGMKVAVEGSEEKQKEYSEKYEMSEGKLREKSVDKANSKLEKSAGKDKRVKGQVGHVHQDSGCKSCDEAKEPEVSTGKKSSEEDRDGMSKEKKKRTSEKNESALLATNETLLETRNGPKIHDPDQAMKKGACQVESMIPHEEDTSKVLVRQIDIPSNETSAKKRRHRKEVSLKADDGDFTLAPKETHTGNLQERYEGKTSAKETGMPGTFDVEQSPKSEKLQKKRKESGEKRKSTNEDRKVEVDMNSTKKAGDSGNALGENKDSLEVTDERSHVGDAEPVGKPEVAAVSAKKQKDTTCEEKTATGALAFKRVHVNKVEYADIRLKDNSYWAKDGAGDGYGAKAQEVLGLVRGRDFRHEKTKKKRGSYRGGAIDLQSHSIKFEASDED